MGLVLLCVYAATMAPGVTFWDAGEFIAAIRVLGIPHPPGTPLFVALGHVWAALLAPAMGYARATNLLSASCTASAGALTALLIARSARADASLELDRQHAWAGAAGALCAGLMTSAWANATETEVYALSLMLSVVLLIAGWSAGSARAGDDRWLLVMVYAIALVPAVHLSALVSAPAAIALATRDDAGSWHPARAVLLGGVMLVSAGVGLMSWPLVGVGALVVVISLARSPRAQRARLAIVIPLAVIGASALLILLVRARHDPTINQGDPSSLRSLAEVVARRQYAVSPLLPRRAPVWLQLATLAQYVDWQFGMSLGRGIFTTIPRVLVTFTCLALGAVGYGAMRRDAPRLAVGLLILTLSGSLGVCAYLNLQSGASIGYGFVPTDAHEARERDYFFVLGFWGWGCFVGYAAVELVRRRHWPLWVALCMPVLPLAANVASSRRTDVGERLAAREVAVALLASAPPAAILFVEGDNDSYPIWYLQAVEGVRPDVLPVTLPLLPADWYQHEIARRARLRWPDSAFVAGARWRHEEVAGLIADAARARGRPIAASAAVQARERAFLGGAWMLRGAVYVSASGRDATRGAPTLDTAASRRWMAERIERPVAPAIHQPDDVSAAMLGLLECPRLALLPPGLTPARHSLELTCNVR